MPAKCSQFILRLLPPTALQPNSPGRAGVSGGQPGGWPGARGPPGGPPRNNATGDCRCPATRVACALPPVNKVLLILQRDGQRKILGERVSLVSVRSHLKSYELFQNSRAPLWGALSSVYQ